MFGIIKNIKEATDLSTVITYRTNAFNIMVCDTRKTVLTVDGNKNIDDSILKMHYIEGFGFISGVGIGELIQDTFNDFQNKSHCIDNLLCSFFAAYDRIASECNKEVLMLLNKTGVIASTQDQIIIMSNSLPYPKKIASLRENTVHIDFPFDCKKTARSLLQKKGEYLQAESPFDALIPILEMFQSIAQNSEDVSSIACISIMGASNNYPFFAQGEVDDLLSALKSNTKSNIKNSFEERKSQLLIW